MLGRGRIQKSIRGEKCAPGVSGIGQAQELTEWKHRGNIFKPGGQGCSQLPVTLWDLFEQNAI